MAQTWIYDGQSVKAVSINNLPPEAWTRISGGGVIGQDKDVRDYYVRVPFLSRAVRLRATAISSLPFAIVNDSGVEIDTSEDYQNEVGFLPNPQKTLELIESSLFLTSKAYLFRQYNRARDVGLDSLTKTLDLRYLMPTTIKPLFNDDEEQGALGELIGFERQMRNRTLYLTPEDLVYFWQLDPYVEIGPGGNSPAVAALSASGVLFNVDSFASTFFERGAVKVTLLTAKGPVPPPERDRLKKWWGRLFQGTKSAWEMDIVQADAIEPVVLGEGVKELSDSQLVKEKREDIAAAAGIPVTLLWSTQGAGLGSAGVTESDERKFYEQTIVPQARFIQGILNEQVFEPLGLRWSFRPETLDVFQEDENERAQAVVHYVSAGMRLGVAAQVLGVELPEGMDYDDLDAQKEEDKEAAAERMPTFGGNPQNPQQNPQQEAMRADLGRWERKALNKGADCDFESEHIPPDVMEQVKAALEGATTDEEVKAAFAAPFRQAAWSWDYP